MYPKLMLLSGFFVVVIQLMATITTPVTTTLSICKYNNISFGVFGYCNMENKECSSVHVGYTTVPISWLSERSLPPGYTGAAGERSAALSGEYPLLPTLARQSVSSLLILHPIALGGSAMQFFMNIGLLLLPTKTHTKKYVLSLFIISWLCFMSALLACLTDLLLFSVSLSWLGWLSCFCTCILGINLVYFFLLRREISSQHAYSKIKKGEQAQKIDPLPIELVSLHETLSL